MYRSSSSSFKSTWGILAGEDSCTLLRSLKRPLKCSDQLWRMASLPVSRVLPSKECRWAWRSKDGLKGFVEGAHVTYIGIPLFLLGKSCPLIVLHGRKLSLECTAGSLICSLGSLIIIYCKQMIVAGAFLFEHLLDFLFASSNQSWCYLVDGPTTSASWECSSGFLDHVKRHPDICFIVESCWSSHNHFLAGKFLHHLDRLHVFVVVVVVVLFCFLFVCLFVVVVVVFFFGCFLLLLLLLFGGVYYLLGPDWKKPTNLTGAHTNEPLLRATRPPTHPLPTLFPLFMQLHPYRSQRSHATRHSTYLPNHTQGQFSTAAFLPDHW